MKQKAPPLGNAFNPLPPEKRTVKVRVKSITALRARLFDLSAVGHGNGKLVCHEGCCFCQEYRELAAEIHAREYDRLPIRNDRC